VIDNQFLSSNIWTLGKIETILRIQIFPMDGFSFSNINRIDVQEDKKLNNWDNSVV
jgi:hypothetical protein